MERRLPSAWRQGLQAWLQRQSDAPAVGELLLRCAAWGLGGMAMGSLAASLELSLLLGALGVVPVIRLRDAAAKRVQAFRQGLPDALDLLTACVQAGLGLDQALQEVAARLAPGPLKQEWERTLAQLRTGLPRREAFAGLEARSGVEELGPVLRAILRSELRGVPLAPVLQAQSRQMRQLRSLRVQKQAAQAPIKMLFPLMVFILPVVFLVVFGPIVLRLSELGF
jgi:tight adherence protein C